MQHHAMSIMQILWKRCTLYPTITGPIKIRLEALGFCYEPDKDYLDILIGNTI